MVNIVTIVSSWVIGKPNIEQASWISVPYEWSVPIWLILFTVILVIVGFVNPIIRYAGNNGWRVAIRKYSLFLALACAGLALTSLLKGDAFNSTAILVFQSLTVLLIILRIYVKNS